MSFQKNDRVVASCEGATIRAHVLLASPNGKSLVLAFPDRMFAGYVEHMPLLEVERDAFIDLFGSRPVALTLDRELP